MNLADQALQPLAIDATLIRQMREQLNLSRSVFCSRPAGRCADPRKLGARAGNTRALASCRAKYGRLMRPEPNAQAAALILMVRKFPDTFGKLQQLRD